MKWSQSQCNIFRLFEQYSKIQYIYIFDDIEQRKHYKMTGNQLEKLLLNNFVSSQSNNQVIQVSALLYVTSK